jgi:hypothetical protein
VQAMARVFPNAQPRWGRFPALRAAWRRWRHQGPRGNARRRWADTRQARFRPPSPRPGPRRLDTLLLAAHGSPAPAVMPRRLAPLPQRLPAGGATWRPTTSHAAARFVGAWARFYRAQGPWPPPASAQKQGDLFR